MQQKIKFLIQYSFQNYIVQQDNIMQSQKDPRATQIHKQDLQTQERTDQVLNQLKTKKNINAFFILSNALDCPQIKEEPEFAKVMFNNHINVVVELIQWMLLPKLLINKKKIKTDVSSYPFQCRQFLKDNNYFYQQFYLNARKKKIQFDIFFSFLRKQNFNKQTIYTALGYFADVMMPFAKYDFSGSYDVKSALQNGRDTNTEGQQTYSILKIIQQNLIDQLLNFCYYGPIFQFLATLILQNIENPIQTERCKSILLKLSKNIQIYKIFNKFPIQSVQVSQQLSKVNESLENFYYFLSIILQQLSQNPYQLSMYIYSLIITILKSDLIQFCINQLLESRLCQCKSNSKMYKSDEIALKKNQQEPNLNQKPSGLSINMSLGSDAHYVIGYGQNLLMLPSMGSVGSISDSQEEQLVQIILKILSTVIQMYQYIQKQSLNAQNSQFSKQRSLQGTRSPRKTNSSPINRNPRSSNYKKKQHIKFIIQQQLDQLYRLFKLQIQFVFDNLQSLNKLVYNNLIQGQNEGVAIVKVLPFASGQNIKAITSMKYQYLRLLWLCLVSYNKRNLRQDQINNNKQGRSNITQFSLSIEKLSIIQIIKKYLSQNKWNNLCHHLLQKICHEIIINNYSYIRKHIQKDKNNKFSSSFLAYLIQNFTKKDFVFLNTVKFTNQGNVYSLYKISKDLAHTLNITNELIILLNQFQPWKKFILNDLKKYEQKVFPKSIKPQQYQDDPNNQSYNIKIDEAQSIKKLVQNIANTKKWAHSSLKLPLKLKVFTKSTKIQSTQQEQSLLINEIKKQKSLEAQHIKRKINAQKDFQKYISNLNTTNSDPSQTNKKETQEKNQINAKHKLTNNRSFSLNPHQSYD